MPQSRIVVFTDEGSRAIRRTIIGVPGRTATVSVGTVTTLLMGEPATVENIGTANDAILDFGIPQGEVTEEQLEAAVEALDESLEASLEFTSAGNVSAALLTDIVNLYINKASGAATQVTVPLSTGRGGRPLEIKDKKRDASSNNITVVFTGGQNADGLTSIVISTDGGWLRMKPDATGWNIMGYQI